MRPLVNKAAGAVLDLLYPRGISCTLCGADLDEPGALCPDCAAELPPAGEEGVLCPGCGRSCTGEERLCRMCMRHGRLSDGGFAAHDYTGRARSLLIAYKFNDRPGLRELFAHGMVRAVREGGVADRIDCVVPVPMHWLRRLNRGYNQSALLAASVATALGRPVVKGVLARPVYTLAAARSTAGPAGRLENAKRSFAPGRGSLEGKTVLLVDDILTTGATLRACAAILRGMGARTVYTAVAAAVPD